MQRGQKEKLARCVDHSLYAEKVTLVFASDETLFLMLVGREAPAPIERLAGVRPPEPPWSHVAAPLDGIPVRLATGGGETGGLEVWVSCAAAQGPRGWDALVGGGAGPIGVTAYESLRIEAGPPLSGPDLGGGRLPP